MRRLTLYVLTSIISFRLHAAKEVHLASESEPLLTVANCVNVVNGSFFHVDQDFMIDGPIPLTFTRHYDSGCKEPDMHKYNHHGYGVSLGYPLELKYLISDKGDKKTYVDQRQRFGIPFKLKKVAGGKKGSFDKQMFKWGYTNCTEALERGQPSLAYTELFRKNDPSGKQWEWEVIDVDGTKRHYKYFRGRKTKRYLLQRTDHPNGLSTHYLYDQLGHLGKVCLRNSFDQEELTSISIHYRPPSGYSIYGSDGKGIVYNEIPQPGYYTQGDKTEWTNYLVGITGYGFPKIDYGYTYPKKRYHQLMNSISFPNGRFLSVEYTDHGRVKSLMAPLDQTGKPKKMYSFDYQDKKTVVTDALGRVNCYYLSDKNRLSAKNEARIRIHNYHWDDYGQLIRKDLRDHKRPDLLLEGIFFSYSDKGNIAEKKECGHIIGDDPETFHLDKYRRVVGNPTCRKYLYEYGEKNTLIRKEDPTGLVTINTYKPGTNLLIATYQGPEGSIQKREFYTYDKNAILIEQIEDDGSGLERENLNDVTYRRIKRIRPQMDRSLYGLTKPAIEEKSYLDISTGQEVLLQRVEIDYRHMGYLGEKRTYDATGTFAYKESCHYNIYTILEETCDRRGYTTRYGYDDNLNISYIHLIGSGKQIYRNFDNSDRLIEEKEVHDDGTILMTIHTYDLMGNLTSTTDAEGYKTQFFYDDLNRKIKEIDPYGHVTTVKYDIQDNPLVVTDKEGNTTTTKYNIDHKPTRINFPDNTVEEFRYYVDGSLKSKKEKDGTFIQFAYDVFGRVLTEKRLDAAGNLLTTKSNIYKGENLIAEIDVEGIVTTYFYDGAGRCISKTRGEVDETYEYDALGRRCSVQRGDKVTFQIFDVMDQVIEERVEDLEGKIYRKTLFSYDIHGNITKKQVFIDDNNSIETCILYNSSNLPVLEVDGKGNQIATSYHHHPFQKITVDPLGQTTIETYDAFKRLILKEIPALSKQEVVYSPNGHRIKQIDHIYKQGIETGVSTVVWEIDSAGNITSLTEQDLKQTRHTYCYGRLQTTQKPDGVILYHSYDGLGRLTEQSSSDGTLLTQYTYDLNGNMVAAYDKVNDRVVKRTYDVHNNITSETTHSTLYYSYDELNRLVEICFPDSTINYTYNAADLVAITRHGKTHSYLYDLAGRLIQENTFDGTTTFYSYDENHHLISITSPYYLQDFVYDDVGNINATTTNHQTTTYAYDGLYQLTAENTTTYSYDSLYNRLSKDDNQYQYNTLHQVLSDQENIYTYDLNGNRLTKNGITYTYDVLNRLTSAGEITYTYDPLGRLQSRVSATSQEFYLYFKDTDLGSLDNLRILGKGIAALEQKGKLYSVIRDHRGSPCAILSDGTLVATYNYNAFGETAYTGTIHSPWQYSAHRSDADTKLLHAAKRVYDPHLGRWLTPDPLGFVDGPNLYAYVHNNPLIFMDPTGLFRERSSKRNFYDRERTRIALPEEMERKTERSGEHVFSFKEFKDLLRGGISFVNGIGTPFQEVKSHARHFGRMAGGYNAKAIYNATDGLFADAIEYFLNRCGVSTIHSRLLHKQWNQFFDRADGFTPHLQICHSQGAVLVRNALMSYPEHLRNRIIVVAIAPGAYIDRSLCKKVTHYVTNGDLVTWLDPIGRYRCREDIVVLKSETWSGFMDHGFQSKTYEEPLALETRNYINQYERPRK